MEIKKEMIPLIMDNWTLKCLQKTVSSMQRTLLQKCGGTGTKNINLELIDSCGLFNMRFKNK